MSGSRLTTAEDAVVNVITGLLHWLPGHGCDEEEPLDRAQMGFEEQNAEAATRQQWSSTSTHQPGVHAQGPK